MGVYYECVLSVLVLKCVLSVLVLRGLCVMCVAENEC